MFSRLEYVADGLFMIGLVVVCDGAEYLQSSPLPFNMFSVIIVAVDDDATATGMTFLGEVARLEMVLCC